jgi:hypothetical protein
MCKDGQTSIGWGSCQQTRDRSGWVFAPQAKKLVLQVSNKGIKGEKECGLKGALLTCKYPNICPVNNNKNSVFRLKINHAEDQQTTCV